MSMRRVQDERGTAVSVWAVLIVTVVTLLVGIAVDLSGQIGAKRLAGDTAAQAARVAGQQLDTAGYLAGTSSLEVEVARARAAALDYVKAAGMTGQVTIESGAELVVSTRATYEPVFLTAIGVGPLEVTGTARVRIVRAYEGEERR
jgi:Flp pilus assembly protein TadG